MVSSLESSQRQGASSAFHQTSSSLSSGHRSSAFLGSYSSSPVFNPPASSSVAAGFSSYLSRKSSSEMSASRSEHLISMAYDLISPSADDASLDCNYYEEPLPLPALILDGFCPSHFEDDFTMYLDELLSAVLQDQERDWNRDEEHYSELKHVTSNEQDPDCLPTASSSTRISESPYLVDREWTQPPSFTLCFD
jgi:hypothetical protein